MRRSWNRLIVFVRELRLTPRLIVAFPTFLQCASALFEVQIRTCMCSRDLSAAWSAKWYFRTNIFLAPLRGDGGVSNQSRPKPLVSHAARLDQRRRWLSKPSNEACDFRLSPSAPRRSRRPPQRPNEPLGFLMVPSGEHVVRGGKHDSLVTKAECARTRIPDAPLPWLRGGPAYKLAG